VSYVNIRVKAKVYQQGYLGCQTCQPLPYAERKWIAGHPGMGDFQRYDTWEEAIASVLPQVPPKVNRYPGTYTTAGNTLGINLCYGFGNGLGNYLTKA